MKKQPWLLVNKETSTEDKDNNMGNFLYRFPSHLNTEISFDLSPSSGAVRQSGGPSPFTGKEFKHALPCPAIPIAPIP